jgi:hypothetical protein
METSDTTGWTDPVNADTIIVTGENVPADATPYTPPPQLAPHYNGSNWLRLGPKTQTNGITLAIYDGTAGGSTADPADYSIEADMFVGRDNETNRWQAGLVGRYVDGVSINNPFEFFYGRNVGSFAEGYGVRGGGATTSYNMFSVAETGDQWVHLKMTVTGGTASVAVDRDKDGTYDLTQEGITLNTTTGKPGFFAVINDPPHTSGLIPDTYAYFDNFKYTPLAGVNDWSVY